MADARQVRSGPRTLASEKQLNGKLWESSPKKLARILLALAWSDITHGARVHDPTQDGVNFYVWTPMIRPVVPPCLVLYFSISFVSFLTTHRMAEDEMLVLAGVWTASTLGRTSRERRPQSKLQEP